MQYGQGAGERGGQVSASGFGFVQDRGHEQKRRNDVDRLRVDQKTIRRWIDAKELPAFKLGRQWRISEQNLRQFLQIRWQG